MKATIGVRSTLGYVKADEAKLSVSGRPFFKGRFSKRAVKDLIAKLELCTRRKRTWFTLAAIEPDITRLTITQSQTPKYEMAAATDYARGDVFRVSGKSKSCNIDFAGEDGGEYLSRKLKAAEKRMQDYLEIRVPSSKRHIIEFWPDVDIVDKIDELDKLAIAGEKLAAEELPSEDFSDWEAR